MPWVVTVSPPDRATRYLARHQGHGVPRWTYHPSGARLYPTRERAVFVLATLRGQIPRYTERGVEFIFPVLDGVGP